MTNCTNGVQTGQGKIEEYKEEQVDQQRHQTEVDEGIGLARKELLTHPKTKNYDI